MVIKTGNHGFTLVEIMVTSLIVAVLAVVAIPSYKGFIRSAQQSAVNNLATTAAASANAYYRKTGTALTTSTVSSLGLFYDATKYTISVVNNSIMVAPIGAISGVAPDTVAYK